MARDVTDTANPPELRRPFMQERNVNQLTVIDPHRPPTFNMGDIERIALAIAKSGMFGIRDPNGVLTLCLLAQAEGQHPAVVFRDYSVISGKPSKKAEAMLRDFISAGGKVEWHTLTDECADATFSHPAGTARISWDKDRAKKAGLGGNGMYAKYPRQMLRSRCISEGVRTVFPGATSGLYVPEEVASFEPANDAPQAADGGEVVEARPEREKVPGITKIKERLRAMMVAGNAPDITLEGFRKLKRDNREDLKTIRDANHEWWTGDGADFEGYGPWIERRTAELTEPEEDGMCAMLIQSMRQCETLQSLANWRDANDEVIAALDGEESRKVQFAYDLHESAIREMDKIHN